MAKNSVSEWSTVSSGNGDIAGLTLGLDMPPSYVNNAMQEMMAQIKQWKDGYTDPITGLPVYQSLTVENIDIEGIANFKGGLVLDGSYGADGQVLVSQGASASPTWGNAFVTGMIMMWSGSIATIPEGWNLCNGSSGTPDLRDKFVVGAGSSYAVNATGGSANAVAVIHNHTASSGVSDPGHFHSTGNIDSGGGSYFGVIGASGGNARNRDSLIAGLVNSNTYRTNTKATGISVSTSVASNGVSGTNKNLPPYYALAYIMKL